jgi:putative cell wall-binding protein
MQNSISKALEVTFAPWTIDARMLHRAQERVNLASKVVAMTDKEQQTQRRNEWFRVQAEAAGFDITDEVLNDMDFTRSNDAQYNNRVKSQTQEAKKAAMKLSQLLLEPLHVRRYGKFVSTSSTVMKELIEGQITSKHTD